MLASGGYPGKYQIGKNISGLHEAAKLESVQIFHAGTNRANSEITTAGGRVLAVTLMRLLFPMTGLMVVSAWCLGVLNTHRRFFLPYAAPALWNVAGIAALVVAGTWLVAPSLPLEQQLLRLSMALACPTLLKAYDVGYRPRHCDDCTRRREVSRARQSRRGGGHARTRQRLGDRVCVECDRAS